MKKYGVMIIIILGGYVMGGYRTAFVLLMFLIIYSAVLYICRRSLFKEAQGLGEVEYAIDVYKNYRRSQSSIEGHFGILFFYDKSIWWMSSFDKKLRKKIEYKEMDTVYSTKKYGNIIEAIEIKMNDGTEDSFIVTHASSNWKNIIYKRA